MSEDRQWHECDEWAKNHLLNRGMDNYLEADDEEIREGARAALGLLRKHRDGPVVSVERVREVLEAARHDATMRVNRSQRRRYHEAGIQSAVRTIAGALNIPLSPTDEQE